MSGVVLSTAYFPPIEWMAHYVQQNSITLEGQEFYQKQTYRSRALIAGPNGTQILNVPVKRKVREIQDCLISYEEDWVKDHVKALESAYGSKLRDLPSATTESLQRKDADQSDHQVG